MSNARRTRRYVSPPWIAWLLGGAVCLAGAGCQRSFPRRWTEAPAPLVDHPHHAVTNDPADLADAPAEARDVPALGSRSAVVAKAPARDDAATSTSLKTIATDTPRHDPAVSRATAVATDAETDEVSPNPLRRARPPEVGPAVVPAPRETPGPKQPPVAPAAATTSKPPAVPEIELAPAASPAPSPAATVESTPVPKPATVKLPEARTTAAPAPNSGATKAAEPLPTTQTESTAVGKAIDPEKPAASKSTPAIASADPWHDGLKQLRDLARAHSLDQDKGDRPWPLRVRVLDWLSGETMTEEQAALWAGVLTPLATATDPEKADEAAMRASLTEAVDALETVAPLHVDALQLCRRVHGFGDVEPIDASALHGGQAVIVYCEVAGLRYEKADDGFRSRLSSRVELIPRGGGTAVWSNDLGTAEDVCRRRRRDYYVNYRLKLPALKPGEYILRVSQADLVGEGQASTALDVTFRP